MKAIDFLKKYGLIENAEKQRMKFGFERFDILAADYDEYLIIKERAIKAKVYAGSHFQAKAVFVMDTGDYELLKAADEEERKAVEDWWIRYNAADNETRKLMACGAIK